jgi:phage tail-like protein
MAQQFIFQLRVTGPELDQAFRVPTGKIVIGRDENVTLPLKHFLVSRRHAELMCRPTGCTITDLGSANGTLVNGDKLPTNAPLPLPDNAIIQIGPFELNFRQIPVESKAEDLLPAPPKEKVPPPEIKTSVPKAVPQQSQPEPEPEPKKPERPLPNDIQPPPGLTIHSQRLLNYLPSTYQTDFMSRFLGIFESILTPIEWNVANLDLFLDPLTAPADFLPWFTSWFDLTFDHTWSEAQRRTILKEAHDLYLYRGTKRALCRVLEIYTGSAPEIIDVTADQAPFTFTVKLPLAQHSRQLLIEQLINAHKPAHTSYQLVFE